jgi:predicted alpha/beta-hydrolase family hydrolase
MDEAPGTAEQVPTTPLEALQVMASSDVLVTPRLRHIEMYTMRGMLTVMWHDPPEGVPHQPGALVLCGGAMGGLLGPGEALYHRLGVEWAARGVPVLRVSYRKPNDLDLCCVDMAAAAQLAIGGAGAEKLVLMGHSFGGAVAVRVGVGLHELMAGVVTFATQSAGCELAAGLQELPFLLFHGEKDDIIPAEASDMVRTIAGHGDVIRIPDDGHLLGKSDAFIWELLEEWLPPLVLAP